MTKEEVRLALLKAAGMRKINFAGGEPFLYKPLLGTLVAFCKDQLGPESVSIVTNGSLVDERFLRQHGKHIDILAVSCDSFNEQTNIDIGRGSGDQIMKLFQVEEWCKEFGIKFKLNKSLQTELKEVKSRLDDAEKKLGENVVGSPTTMKA